MVSPGPESRSVARKGFRSNQEFRGCPQGPEGEAGGGEGEV